MAKDHHESVWRIAFLISLVLVVIVNYVVSYNRQLPCRNVCVSLSKDDDSSTPQQVHISIVGADKMRISWITNRASTPTVSYGTAPGVYQNSVTGTTSSYRYLMYKSGQIHDAVIGPLNANTLYYYRCGQGPSSKEFNFISPPAQFPVKFAVIGDLGQTKWTKSTLQQISKTDYDVLLLPGDLAYADFIHTRWDSFGRLVEPLASQRPWMVTQGNHEVEKIPVLHGTPFTAYNSRWLMPYEESGSDSNLYYSFDVAGVHIIMLGSYIDFNPDSEQYKWLKRDLNRIDRTKTPWIAVLIHTPWYNSNKAHQGEKESVDMKKYMEELLYQAGVDLVFAGHVHAYERFTRVYQGKADKCGPVHITIGDGGNREGLAKNFIEPKQEISMFREASFGHGQLEVVNGSSALWTWNRNDDHNVNVVSDAIWLTSLSSDPSCKV